MTAGRAGAGPTGAVTLTDDLPDDAVFVSATPSAGTCGTPQGAGLVLTCSLGDVAGGAAPITVRVRVRLTAPGTATNRASLAAVNADAVTAMAQTDVASPPPANVTPARLALSKTGPARVNAGAVATYQLTVANRSSVTASKVIVTDQLPRGARLVSVRSRGVACTKPVPTCAFGDLAPGASAAVTIRARLLSAGTRTDVARATATNAAAVQDAATTRVNGVPVAVRDRYRTRENRRLRILPQGVLRNDRDTEGAAHLRVTGGIAGGAVVSLSRAVRTFRTRHGSVRLGSDGAFTYTPRRGFTGVDAFSYRATDGRATSAAARVTIVVVGVPRPRFTG